MSNQQNKAHFSNQKRFTQNWVKSVALQSMLHMDTYILYQYNVTYSSIKPYTWSIKALKVGESGCHVMQLYFFFWREQKWQIKCAHYIFIDVLNNGCFFNENTLKDLRVWLWVGLIDCVYVYDNNEIKDFERKSEKNS